jgi:hypothetical protein
MAATTFEAQLGSNQPTQIWKALGGLIYTAPMTAALPTAFTTLATADLDDTWMAAYTQLGLITKGEGVVFSRDVQNETEESWGYNEPTRTDIGTDITSAAFTLQEVTRASLELYDFVDLSAVTPDATTGEVSYNKPLITAPQYRRMIFLGVDGAGTDRRYRVKVMPRAQVIAVSDESWTQAAATRLPVTVRATVDSTAGYAVRNVLAGPGQKTRNAAAGFGA